MFFIANVGVCAVQKSSGYFLHKTSGENPFARRRGTGNEEARREVKSGTRFDHIFTVNVQD